MSRLRKIRCAESPYYSLLSSNIALKMAIFNARSARLHFLDILTDPVFSDLDIICLSETHIAENQFDQYKIPEYKAHFLPYTKSQHGLAIYSKPYLEAELIQESPSKAAERLHINIVHQQLSEISFLYRSPSANISEFMKDLDLLVPFTYKSSQCVIVGDFNIDPHNNRNAFRNLCDLMHQKDFTLLTTTCTTIHGTMLDLVFSNSAEKQEVVPFGTYYSDHAVMMYLIHRNNDNSKDN